ncbi:MAG: hypothetical protein F6K26_34675 [Moorea sp. SIO2I5]|nr:hypothetical protein [Moorena sp. SIO2I5]
MASGDYGFLKLGGSNGDTILRGGDNHNSIFPGNLNLGGGLYVTNVPYGDHKNAQWKSSTGQLYHDNSSAKTKENIISLEDDFEKILTV